MAGALVPMGWYAEPFWTTAADGSLAAAGPAFDPVRGVYAAGPDPGAFGGALQRKLGSGWVVQTGYEGSSMRSTGG